MSEVLLIRHPGLVLIMLAMIGVLDIEINSSYVVLVSSVLDVLHVTVCKRNTVFRDSIRCFGQIILMSSVEQSVFAFEDFDESLLSLFAVDLAELLSVNHLFIDKVLLLLRNISKVTSRAASPNLSGLYDSSFRNNSS